MKKLMILAATTAAISSSAAFAEMGMDMEQFYIKAALGANKMIKTKVSGIRLKSKAAPVVNLAVGYSVMENVRAELEGGYVFNPKMRGNSAGVRVSTKPKIWTLMVNGYADVFEMDLFKAFVGAGLGTAAVKDKVNLVGTTTSGSSKRKYNFSYQLTAGVSFCAAEGVEVELAYRWQDYGKSKATNTQVVGGKAPKYKGNNLVAGVRFAI
jgi:opacity protein-like surface antigen